MCLAIPGKVVEVYLEHELTMGKVDFGGVSKRVCLEYIQQPIVGDYVLVHVGFALARIDEVEARQVFEFLERMQELDELSAAPEPTAPIPPQEEPSGQLPATRENSAEIGVRP